MKTILTVLALISLTSAGCQTTESAHKTIKADGLNPKNDTNALGSLMITGCRTAEPVRKTIPTRSGHQSTGIDTTDTGPSTKSRRSRPELTADLEIPAGDPKRAKLVIRLSSDF